MEDINAIKEMLSGGTVPAGADTKRFNKLLKKYNLLTSPKFTKLHAMCVMMI